MLFTLSNTNAQYYKLSGKVFNNRMEPLAYASVYLQGLGYGTTTNDTGFYQLEVPLGTYKMSVSMVGFKTSSIEVTLGFKDAFQNFVLENDSIKISGAIVTAKRVDPSLQIIKNAISVREKYLANLNSYSCEVYIKAVDESTHKQNRSRNKKLKQDSARLNFAEVQLTRNFKRPDKVKEIRNGVRVNGNTDGLYFLTTTDGEFNFYHNLIKVPELSSIPIMSPLNNAAPIVYKFRLINTYFENGRKIYRIKVSPRQIGNSLVSGEIHIADSLWYIQKIDVELPSDHIDEYDYFSISQEYKWINDSVQLPVFQQFKYINKYRNSKTEGNTVVSYSNFNLEPNFPKHFFGTEISTTTQEAYERDSAFWVTLRPVPLTERELRHIRVSDSVKAAHNKKEYLDSVQRATNKITFMRVLLLGQERMNHEKETYWSFRPLAGAYEWYNLGGPRVGYWLSYQKKLKNKKEYNIAPYVTYGLNNKDIQGNFSFYKLYNTFSRAYYGFAVGRHFDLINDRTSYIARFSPNNWYLNQNVTLFQGIEILNGLHARAQLEYSQRKSLDSFKFSGVFDQLLYPGGVAEGFDLYNAFYTNLTLSYTPKQRYIREPFEKIILGSKYPTFSVNWRRGYPKIGGSSIDFDYLEFRMRHNFKLGMVGNTQIRFTSGKFIRDNEIKKIDYKYQRRRDPYLFANPLVAYQMLDSTITSFNWYYELHVVHNFNGALFSKIPFMKHLGLREVVGGGFLYNTDNNYRHVEAFAGVERVFRIFRERFKIGVFMANSYSNYGIHLKPMLKIGFDAFNARTNQWSSDSGSFSMSFGN